MLWYAFAGQLSETMANESDAILPAKFAGSTMTLADTPLELLVRSLRLRAPLADADADAIRALPHTVRLLEAGTYTVREADSTPVCGVLISGFAYRQKTSSDGDRQIVSVLIPGDALDLQNIFLDVSDHSVQMLTRGEIAVLQRADVQALIRENAAVARAMMVNILTEASILREWVLNVGQRSGKERAAHLLCEIAIRLKAAGLADQYAYELPMTQEQLGDALGLTPVHVNRMLKALQADGLITRTKRVVQFPNWEAMRNVAGFNERYLHLEVQRNGMSL